MSGWGIAETAPKIEKIKAESADYLNGLNSCGEIPWEVYNYVFDFYAELIQKAYELGKSEAELNWIPVKEKLPDRKNKSYWICTNTGYQCQCRWTNNIYGLGTIGNEWGWKVIDIPQYTYVIAWRELPESFKEVTE